MGDFQQIADQFTQFYYQTFDNDRSQLAALYRDSSMLTFEKEPFQGTASIVGKLQSLPFEKIQHRVDTTDAQPMPNNGIAVLVTGALMVDEQPQPMSYVQIFTLMQENGGWYVLNDLFRLVYSASG